MNKPHPGDSMRRANPSGRDDAKSIRIALLISNLEYGGAQRQVVELANHLNAGDVETHVVCLSDYVPLARYLHQADARLHVVAKHVKFDVSVVPRLAGLLRRLDTTIVHTFLFDAEIAARLAGAWNGRLTVIGSERNTDYRRKWRHWTALHLTKRCVDAVIANSHAGKRFQMKTLGIRPDRIFVVHNGVDVLRFSPKPEPTSRRRLNIAPDAPVIGLFASFKRQKNHPMFFRMARRVLGRFPGARFLCVGAQLHGGLQASGDYSNTMRASIEAMALQDAVLLLGNRDDLPELYNVCDVTVLTSRREGTPNVLLESMACGVPVVATDVADNSLVVPNGRVGYVVPYDDDEAMAERVVHLLSDTRARRALGMQARQWVEQHFSTDVLARKTLAAYREVLSRKNGGQR